jgi:hypothetical protein
MISVRKAKAALDKAKKDHGQSSQEAWKAKRALNEVANAKRRERSL